MLMLPLMPLQNALPMAQSIALLVGPSAKPVPVNVIKPQLRIRCPAMELLPVMLPFPLRQNLPMILVARLECP